MTEFDSDSGTAEPALVGRQVAAVAIGKPFPEHKSIKLTHAALDAFAGSYKVDETTTRVVRRAGNQLLMQRGGRDQVALYPYAPASFFIKGSHVTFAFSRNAKGGVDSVTMQDDGIEFVNNKRGAAPQ